ncbi:MAG: hypothetical protein ABII74_10350 [Elusimicrobiota bacterium]
MIKMRKITVVVAVVLLIFGISGFSFSASLEEQMELTGIGPVKTNYKDPGHAAKLAFNFTPIAYGQFYVGEWKKGIWFTVGEVLLATGVVVPAYDVYTRSKKDPSPESEASNTSVIKQDTWVIAVSFLGYAALKVWSAYDAGYGAERYNTDHKTANLFFRLGPKSAQLCFKYGF